MPSFTSGSHEEDSRTLISYSSSIKHYRDAKLTPEVSSHRSHSSDRILTNYKVVDVLTVLNLRFDTKTISHVGIERPAKCKLQAVTKWYMKKASRLHPKDRTSR